MTLPIPPAPRPDASKDVIAFYKQRAQAAERELDIVRTENERLRTEAAQHSASPLPEEIAGLIAKLQNRAEERSYATGGNFPRETFYEWQAADALQQMARENERLIGIEADYLRRHKDACDRWERIHELEAERDRCRETNQVLMGQWEAACTERDAIAFTSKEKSEEIARLEEKCANLEKARDFAISAHNAQVEDKETIAGWLAAAHKEMGAIRAKTIEDLAQIAFNAGCGMPDCIACVGGALAAKFRALNQPPEAGEGGE